jgi:hypothetical protein
MAVNKITWERVGRVTEPGRYMYKFGWLTITAGDLKVWEQYPHAAFTLLAEPGSANSVGEEFHLGAFDISPSVSLGISSGAPSSVFDRTSTEVAIRRH